MNCWRCQDGAKPCIEDVPHHNCAYPSKRPESWADAVAIAQKAVHGNDGRGMIGDGRRHLVERVARALLGGLVE